MFFQIKSYIKFLLKSTNEHGVHSPFVFALVTKCFYDRKRYDSYVALKKYRSQLANDKTEIQVTDFGAGSRVFRSNIRSVCDIAENAGISEQRAKLLFRIVNYFKLQNVLEIGTSVGLSTIAMAEGNANSNITTLEGCPQTAEVAASMLREFQHEKVKIVVGEFDAFLSEIDSNTKFDLIYFDGNHSKEATLNYFEKLLPTITNDSCWIFDDIHWSTGMEAAWNEIKNRPEVRVTIDTFQWGIVFFRKEQEKENFTIRV